MTDCRRIDLKRQWLLLLLLCASLAGLRAQCTDLPVFGDLPENVTQGCDQFVLAGLPAASAACFRVNANTGAPEAGTLSAALRAALEAGGGLPLATSSCGGVVEICSEDVLLTNPPEACTGLIQIRRTYRARNLAANAPTAPASFAQEISFLRPQLSDLEGEPAVTFVIPDTGEGLPENPAPRSEDYPFLTINQQEIYFGANFCQFSVSYQDGDRNNGCGNNFMFVRTYTVSDGCAGDGIRTFTQIVRVGDQQQTMITPPLQVSYPLRFGTNTDCGSVVDARLTGLSVSDICDGSSALDAYVFLRGDLSSTPLGPYAVFGPVTQPFTDPLPLGPHIIRYLGQDSYGNTTTLDIDIEVVDNTPPAAVCVPNLAVALDESGTVRVTADRLDGGSSDNCSSVSLTLARADANGAPRGEFVDALNLDCTDKGISNLLLQVTDGSNRNNHDRCVVSVTTVDIQRPTCLAPGAVALTCRAFANNLPQDITTAFAADPVAISALLDATFGAATGTDNCTETTVGQSVLGSLSSCGTGRITRRFTVTDGAGFTQASSCQQVIDVQQYTEYSLQFPGNRQITCAELPTPENLVLGDTGCELMVITTNTDTLENDGTSCLQLRFVHEIINWCEYDGVGAPVNVPNDPDGDGNLQPSVFLHINAVSATTLTDDLATLDVDNDVRNGNELHDVVEAYGTSGRRGFFRYEHEVDIFDNTAPVAIIPTPEGGQTITEDCLGGIILRFTATDDCTVPHTTIDLDIDVVDINEDGQYGEPDFREDRTVNPNRFEGTPTAGVEVFIRLLPIGKHLARVRTTDDCGNVDEQFMVLDIQDSKAPTPDCREINTVALTPDIDFGGITSVFATDFIDGPPTVCTQTPITYAVYTEATASRPGFVPQNAQVQIAFDCSDLGEQILRVYAFSETTGLHDYCNVSLTITSQDSSICAGRQGSLGGVILTEAGDPMVGIDVFTEGQLSLSTRTDIDGSFYFDGLQEARDYAVRPYFNDNPINGISTFDISEISRYLLGEDIGLTAYQYIAADANRSGNITIIDLLEIRGVLLGIEDNFDNNTSWRFVAADYVFPVPTNPWVESFPEAATFTDLTGHAEADFIAVKVGDINGSARPINENFGPAGEGSNTGRSTAPTALLLQPHPSRANTQQLWFSDDLFSLAGLQLSLRLPIGTRVSSAQLTPEQYTVDEYNVLHLSYATGLDGPLTPTLPLFDLEQTSTSPHSLTLAGRLLAEGYLQDGQIFPLVLEGREGAPSFKLGVYPNPVQERAVISFAVPKDGIVEQSIIDVSGSTVSKKSIRAYAGENQQPLLRTDFGSQPGIYFIKLQQEDHTEVLRLVVQ